MVQYSYSMVGGKLEINWCGKEIAFYFWGVALYAFVNFRNDYDMRFMLRRKNVGFASPGADPGFLDRGFKFTKGGLICTFYLIIHSFFLIFL